ncbi:MAG: polysaccharide biosynthesis protein PslG, partial [Mycobacterium sp.]|nr:polysaccharide biosynthesis protein PslG [Mycobacterium sp.]
PWAGAEPVQNQFDWTNVDRTVNAAVARNMAVIGIINASPAWALTDEVREGWATKVTFEHGYITWLPWIGTQVTFT